MRRIVDRSGFLINSHDPLRGHVLKHIRQNSLTSLRYSVAEQGKEMRKPITTALVLRTHLPAIIPLNLLVQRLQLIAAMGVYHESVRNHALQVCAKVGMVRAVL